MMNRNPYLLLKAAVRDLIAAAGGNVRAARVSRADNARLSRYGSVSESTHAPIDVIADLEQEVGEPIVTRILADLAGYDLVPKAAAAPGGAAFIRHLGDVAQSSGRLLSDLGEAVADGTVTAAERARLHGTVRRAQTELAELDADLDAGREGGA